MGTRTVLKVPENVLEVLFVQKRRNNEVSGRRYTCSRHLGVIQRCPAAAAAKETTCPGTGAEDSTRVRVNQDITLSDITDQQLNQFMSKKAAVNMLVNCFNPKMNCKFRTARALVSDVRKLGKGGVCGGDVCTNGQEKAKVERLVKRAIAIMQKRHRSEWRRLIPNIAFLL